jgi:hypothetical protein
MKAAAADGNKATAEWQNGRLDRRCERRSMHGDPASAGLHPGRDGVGCAVARRRPPAQAMGGRRGVSLPLAGHVATRSPGKVVGTSAGAARSAAVRAIVGGQPQSHWWQQLRGIGSASPGRSWSPGSGSATRSRDEELDPWQSRGSVDAADSFVVSSTRAMPTCAGNSRHAHSRWTRAVRNVMVRADCTGRPEVSSRHGVSARWRAPCRERCRASGCPASAGSSASSGSRWHGRNRALDRAAGRPGQCARAARGRR